LISLLGIVNHLTHVEWRWIDGSSVGPPSGPTLSSRLDQT